MYIAYDKHNINKLCYSFVNVYLKGLDKFVY